ncbi:MAG TPA: hypothetical protein VMT37_04245 [Solirubrobacterales bacterium]|nr:hypothetical protein [Solirubrobacterales bacterium]
MLASSTGARAAEPELHCTGSSSYCFITGSSTDNALRLEGGLKLTCTTQLSATAASTAATAVFAPTYSKCKAAGLAATVKSEGCVYSVHLVEEGTTPYPTTTAVVCPEGKKLTIEAAGLPCTVTIGSQSGLSGLTLEDVEATHVKATFALKGIAYTAVGSGCGGEGSRTAEYTGTMPLNGYEDLSGSEGSAVWLHVL